MPKNKQKQENRLLKGLRFHPKGKVLNRGQGFRHLRGKKK